MKIAWIVDFQRVCYNLSQLIHIFKLTPAQAKTIHFLKKEKLYFLFYYLPTCSGFSKFHGSPQERKQERNAMTLIPSFVSIKIFAKKKDLINEKVWLAVP